MWNSNRRPSPNKPYLFLPGPMTPYALGVREEGPPGSVKQRAAAITVEPVNPPHLRLLLLTSHQPSLLPVTFPPIPNPPPHTGTLNQLPRLCDSGVPSSSQARRVACRRGLRRRPPSPPPLRPPPSTGPGRGGDPSISSFPGFQSIVALLLYYDHLIECTMESTLLDGLPNEVARQCLARVPFLFHPMLQLVCRSWRASVRSGELLKIRNQIGTTEELLCVLAFEPENMWQLYDPLRDKWITLPIMPSQIRNIARFGVASVAGKLYVIGGGSDRVDPLTGDHDTIFASNEVWSYDPLHRLWSQRAPMLVARAMFACCALDGKIIVAGGFTNCRKSISKAEIYDPEADTWEPLPDLRQAHSSACSGLVIKGKMHVLHKGLSTVQILEDGGSHWAVEDFSWLQGPMAMVGGELYVLSNSCIMKQRGENFPDKMVSCASEFQSRIGFGMIGLGNSIYLVGGVIGPGPRNQCIKPLSDVDILNVTSERPTWRPGSPMTHCRGSICGCALLRI